MFRTVTDIDVHYTRLPEQCADLSWSPYRNTFCSWNSVPIANASWHTPEVEIQLLVMLKA